MSSRTCAKPGCSVSATATMVYDHAGRTVLLESLNPEAHPMHYDLCVDHADNLRVPVGWQLEDHRGRARLRVAS
jgi:hypothetical protein